MLEALTIFTKGGLVLFHYRANPSLTGDDNEGNLTRTTSNSVLLKVALENPSKNFHIDQGLSFVWTSLSPSSFQQQRGRAASAAPRDYIVMAVYPDILFEGPRQYLRQWADSLIVKVSEEYSLYYKAATNGQDATRCLILQRPEPDPVAFDKTFRLLLEQSKTQQPQQQNNPPSSTGGGSGNANSKTDASTSTAKSGKSGGKEKRQWHDGKGKLTKKAMDELDMSAEKGDEASKAEAHERALQEARKTYLPSETELLEAQQDTAAATNATGDGDGDSASSWSSSVTGLFQQLTGNKVLSKKDLEVPLEKMRDLLTQKNVARDIAAELCRAVEASLVGKRLNSLYRVQTAVRQAMEGSITKLLSRKEVDLLRAVMTKRGDGSFFKSSSGRPYVIVVMGINGIGKTTSLAKLAYFFSQNNCKPLLVAGDTFRSGAVEQLEVHSTCLNLPLYSQGYSKDPSQVAKAAIQHASENGNDVVLMDTAGRMQNNVPLMKALGKLVKENKPDCILLVAEALVGHDGLDQFQMFQKAIVPRPVDGLLLTKYDTVSDKVGAALTLTHETGAPIVFVGTGQKYHHLRKLNVSQVIDSLFS